MTSQVKGDSGVHHQVHQTTQWQNECIDATIKIMEYVNISDDSASTFLTILHQHLFQMHQQNGSFAQNVVSVVLNDTIC